MGASPEAPLTRDCRAMCYSEIWKFWEVRCYVSLEVISFGFFRSIPQRPDDQSWRTVGSSHDSISKSETRWPTSCQIPWSMISSRWISKKKCRCDLFYFKASHTTALCNSPLETENIDFRLMLASNRFRERENWERLTVKFVQLARRGYGQQVVFEL